MDRSDWRDSTFPILVGDHKLRLNSSQRTIWSQAPAPVQEILGEFGEILWKSKVMYGKVS